MKIILAVLLLAFLSASSLRVASATDDRWDKYIPEKDRKQASKGAGKLMMGKGFLSSERAMVMWITDSLARGFVSRMIDRQRLVPADAERRYQELRLPDKYVFLMQVWFNFGNMRPSKTKGLANPIDGSTVFLQRADDNGVFSRGTATQTEFDLFDGPADYQSTYIVAMSKTTDKGVPVIRDISDKVELQFEVAGKKSKVTYSLTEVVSKLDDL
jgi:hypothetical protein